MSVITDVKCVLSQKAFDAFCEKFHIPEEVHPILPNQGDTMHEKPAGKIGHFRINISQLSVIRGGQDYATLVAHPSLFRKFPEEFLCLVGLIFHYTLDEETYPLFLDKDKEGERLLLHGYLCLHSHSESYQVAPDRAKSELEANVDKLFDKGGSGAQTKQGDSAGGGGGQGVNIQPVIKVADAAAEDVAHAQPRRQKKRKTIVADAGRSSHLPRKLRGDHGTPSGTSVGGKSRSVVQRLLAGAVQNAEVRGEPIPTLPFVASSVSAMAEHEGKDHTDSVTGLNLRTISAPQRFVISSDSSHHFGANVAEAEVDSFTRPSVPVITAATTIASTADPDVVVKEKIVKPSILSADSTLAGGTDLTGSDFLWNVTNGPGLDDDHVCREMVDEFAPSKFFASVRGMEHDQLFTEFNVEAARQMYLSAEVRMRAEYNVKERRRLKFVIDEKEGLLKVREEEIESLMSQLLLKEAEVAEAISHNVETSKFEAVKKSLQDEVKALKERNTTLEKEKNDLMFMSWRLLLPHSKKKSRCMIIMALHLEERFYPHLLTTIFNRRWLLTQGIELAIVKCLHSPEYLSALGAAIGKAIEKGMQDGLSAGITHGKEGRTLTDVAAHNPSVEVDYIVALEWLQNINFPLLG
ncbi:hypothetical protein Tco_0133347 [Tanacetum coccineum]